MSGKRVIKPGKMVVPEPAGEDAVGVDIEWTLTTPLVEDALILSWMEICARSLGLPAFEVAIRIVDMEEMTELNEQYRNRPGPTNVLSFPNGLIDEAGRELLGDIVLCGPVVLDEARSQKKTSESHLAHLIIHGLLHLRGLVHDRQTDAEEMEEIEVRLMRQLGFSNPYREIA